MPTQLQNPGVYIQELKPFPGSIIAAETAIPAFIGYTSIAAYQGKNLINIPTKVTSLAEYETFFGTAFTSQFTVKADFSVKIKDNHSFHLYNSIRLFYANGGDACYIISVGTYNNKRNGLPIDEQLLIQGLNTLVNNYEPTLIVIPDAIILGESCYSKVYIPVLAHCASMQSCFAILDLVKPQTESDTANIISGFRERIGQNDLSYGAAYYPWLQTHIVTPNEVTFQNIDNLINLDKLLPEPKAKDLITRYETLANPTDEDKNQYHISLGNASPVYLKILESIRLQLNLLPPSGAMAGIYTTVDNTNGIWQSPANVMLNSVDMPNINISDSTQEPINVDPKTGKSVNAIRNFSGRGTMVWGARTLDGNSMDYLYINIRRTLIMIEQSLKTGARILIFEPNDATTWITMKSAMTSFLNDLWKQGALMGASPNDAYDVQIGLGSSMTSADISDGVLRVRLNIAVSRPGEFITITFEQTQAK